MRMIGLVGGMSWESSAGILPPPQRRRLHPFGCNRFGSMPSMVVRLCGKGSAATCRRLAPPHGADGGRRTAASAVGIPLIHIADPTAERIVAAGLRKVGLLGTAFTMEQDFYRGRLTERYGLDVIVPGDEDRATVHRIIL